MQFAGIEPEGLELILCQVFGLRLRAERVVYTFSHVVNLHADDLLITHYATMSSSR